MKLPKKTLTVELNDFFDNNKSKNEVAISKQAFSLRRQKIDEIVFKDIIDITLKNRYECKDIKLYKGFIYS